jgi:hypothetical protein
MMEHGCEKGSAAGFEVSHALHPAFRSRLSLRPGRSVACGLFSFTPGANIGIRIPAMVEDGLYFLTQAVSDRPAYSDAMAYLNLIYRRKADLDWDNDEARKRDLVQAEMWRDKAMATRHEGTRKAVEDESGARSAAPQR